MDDSGSGSQDTYIRICFSSLDMQTCHFFPYHSNQLGS